MKARKTLTNEEIIFLLNEAEKVLESQNVIIKKQHVFAYIPACFLKKTRKTQLNKKHGKVAQK